MENCFAGWVPISTMLVDVESILGGSERGLLIRVIGTIVSLGHGLCRAIRRELPELLACRSSHNIFAPRLCERGEEDGLSKVNGSIKMGWGIVGFVDTVPLLKVRGKTGR